MGLSIQPRSSDWQDKFGHWVLLTFLLLPTLRNFPVVWASQSASGVD